MNLQAGDRVDGVHKMSTLSLIFEHVIFSILYELREEGFSCSSSRGRSVGDEY